MLCLNTDYYLAFSLLRVISVAPLSANAAYCAEKDIDAELGDTEGALMRCEQTMPLLGGGHLGGLYTQSLHCDRPSPDLQLQDSSRQDTR